MDRYTITDGQGTEAVILPEKGATTVSLTKDGVEFLYQNPGNLSSDQRPRCGIPFLFPIFGTLTDDRYEYDGMSYPMTIHGFGHTSSWQVISASANSLTVMLEASEETRKCYPFEFRVTLTFHVDQGWFSVRQCYENRGDRPMPFNFGFHPYFRVEQLRDVVLDAAAVPRTEISRWKITAHDEGMVEITVPEGRPEHGTTLSGVHSPVAIHLIPEGREVTLEFCDSVTQLVLWTMADMPFLCVEPVSSTNNSLLTGKGLCLLPGRKHEAWVRIRPRLAKQ